MSEPFEPWWGEEPRSFAYARDSEATVTAASLLRHWLRCESQDTGRDLERLGRWVWHKTLAKFPGIDAETLESAVIYGMGSAARNWSYFATQALRERHACDRAAEKAATLVGQRRRHLRDARLAAPLREPRRDSSVLSPEAMLLAEQAAEQAAERAERVRRAVARLRHDDHVTAVFLRYWRNCTFPQIGNAQGVSAGTARARHNAALALLRRDFADIDAGLREVRHLWAVAA